MKSMTTSQARFFHLLDRAPRIRHLWDDETLEMDIDLFSRELGVMGTGEIHLVKFFAAVWFNNNTRFGFDLVDAVASLDGESISIIQDWIADPFWP